MYPVPPNSRQYRKRPAYAPPSEKRARVPAIALFLSLVLCFSLLALLCAHKAGASFRETEAIAVEPVSAVEKEADGLPQQMAATQTPAAGILLPADPILQKPELPNGCEATSLAVMLQYYGYPADKMQMAYEYIPREDFFTAGDVRYGPSPDTAYAGDPAINVGFYCFAGPIAAGANRYLSERESSLQCEDISGTTPDDWRLYLESGAPVMLWVTLDFGAEAKYLDYRWQLPDGSDYTPFKNLHCIVLVGYDDATFTLCDPLSGLLTLDAQALYSSYLALGAHAAVIY